MKTTSKPLLDNPGLTSTKAVTTEDLVETTTTSRASTPRAVGGWRDEHGCLLPAGYTWCEARRECVMEWETPCDDARPVEQTTPQMDEGYTLIAQHKNTA